MAAVEGTFDAIEMLALGIEKVITTPLYISLGILPTKQTGEV